MWRMERVRQKTLRRSKGEREGLYIDEAGNYKDEKLCAKGRMVSRGKKIH